MKITELISDFNSLFSYFVPGAICVWVYTRLSMKKIEYAAYVIISISLGYLFKNFVDGYAPQCLITVVPSALLYVVLGFICGILFYLIKNSFPARKFFAHFLSVETADNIWTKFFDTKRGTKILVFTKDGKVIYGKLSSADDDYIVVIHHCTANSADDIPTALKEHRVDGTVLCIKMSEVERFELMYMDNNSPYQKFNIGGLVEMPKH